MTASRYWTIGVLAGVMVVASAVVHETAVPLRSSALKLRHARSKDRIDGLQEELLKGQSGYTNRLLYNAIAGPDVSAKSAYVLEVKLHDQMKAVSACSQLSAAGRDTMKTLIKKHPLFVAKLASNQAVDRYVAIQWACNVERVETLAPILALGVSDPSEEIRRMTVSATAKLKSTPKEVTVAMMNRLWLKPDWEWARLWGVYADEYEKQHVLEYRSVLLNGQSKDLEPVLVRILESHTLLWEELVYWLPVVSKVGSNAVRVQLRRCLDDREVLYRVGEQGGSAMSDLALYGLLDMTGQDPKAYGMISSNRRSKIGTVWGFAEGMDRAKAMAKFEAWTREHQRQR
jgi:hypothetical protein